MANDSSFDVVSRLDRQEVDNAVNQCAKEISQRYDFRGDDASVSLSGDTITLEANTAERVLAIEAGDDVEGGVVGHGGSPFRGRDFSRPESRRVVL